MLVFFGPFSGSTNLCFSQANRWSAGDEDTQVARCCVQGGDGFSSDNAPHSVREQLLPCLLFAILCRLLQPGQVPSILLH